MEAAAIHKGHSAPVIALLTGHGATFINRHQSQVFCAKNLSEHSTSIVSL